MPISHEEFERWMGVLREDIQGVNTRLDVLNGRTRSNEQAIAILQDRNAQAKDPAARWTGLSGVVAAAATFVWQLWSGK